MYTKDQFVKSYLLLGSPDPLVKEQANRYIMELLERDEAWVVAKVQLKFIQELLDSANIEHMFFGAQILHQKTEYSFASLDAATQQGLRAYVFELLVRLCNERVESRPVLAKLASAAAVIGCSMIADSWPTFLDDLVGIMKKSLWHLRACIEVIDYCTDAIKNLRGVRHAEREYVRSQFLRRQDLLFQIFNDVLQLNDPLTITRSLECLESWCKFTLPAMKNASLIKNVLKVCLNSEDNFDLTGQIIASCFSQINCTNIAEATTSVVLKSRLDANELENLGAIVQFLVLHLNDLYGPNNHRYVKDQIVTNASSHLCRIYTFIMQRVLVDFPWVVTEDTQNAGGRQLLLAMITTLKHRSLEVSDIALELFYQFFGQVSKIKEVQQEEFKVALLKCYVEVHRIVLSRAQRTRLLNDLVPVEEDCMEEDDATEGAGDLFKITFAQYRKDCREFFACAYQVFKELAGSNGASFFFDPVLALLQPLPDDPLASNKIEAALFAVSSCMISLTADDDNHSYIERILTYVCTHIQSTTNPNVRAESFRLLSNCAKEVNSKPELFMLVLRHLLSAVDNSKVGLEAVNSLTAITELCKSHSYYQSVEGLIAFYSSSFASIHHEAVIQKFIGVLLQFGFRIANPDAKNQSFRAIFEVLLQRIEAGLSNLSNDTSSQLSIRCKELENVAGILQQLSNGDKRQEFSAVVPTVSAFINQAMHVMTRLLDVCLNQQAQLDSQTSTAFDLCLRSLKNTYPFLIKSALNAFPTLLQPKFLSVLEEGIKLFIAFPVTNSAMLSLWANTLQEYSKRTLRNAALDEWLAVNYPSFCNYCIATPHNSDPDIVKHCYQVHLAVLIYQPHLFWGFDKCLVLYERALQALQTLNERVMQKMVIYFLEQFVRQFVSLPNNPKPDFVPLLRVLFNCLPQLNPLTFIPCSHILFDAVPASSEPQFLLQELLKQSQHFGAFPEPKILLLAKALDLYIRTKDDRSMKSTLIAICQLASSSMNDSDTWMAIELNYQRNNRAYRAMLRNQQPKH